MKFAYIDAFEGGRQMTYQAIRERMSHMVPGDEDMTASPGECVRRMLRNLISIGASRSNHMRDGSYSLLRCALELMLEVNTTDTMHEYAFMLSRIYLQLNINQHEVRALLADQLNPGMADQVDFLMHQCHLQLEEKKRERPPTVPNKRGVAAFFPNGEVRYYVGQVCRHAKYHYTCVIHGWDPQCTASASWISHMGVDKLPLKDKQPFYNVLVADGSQRYAAQENLVICPFSVNFIFLSPLRFLWIDLAPFLTQKLVATSPASTPLWVTSPTMSLQSNIRMRINSAEASSS